MNEEEISLIVPKDHLLNSPIRLTIMMLLYVHKRINVRDLQKLLQVTPGNLDHHLKKLEAKNFLQKRRLISPTGITMYVLKSKVGDNFLLDYITSLKEVLDRFQDQKNG